MVVGQLYFINLIKIFIFMTKEKLKKYAKIAAITTVAIIVLNRIVKRKIDDEVQEMYQNKWMDEENARLDAMYSVEKKYWLENHDSLDGLDEWFEYEYVNTTYCPDDGSPEDDIYCGPEED